MKTWLFFVLLFMATLPLAAQSDYKINSDSCSVKFSVMENKKTVEGTFSNLKATIKFDPQNPGKSYLEANIPVSAINTGVKMRDKHLQKKDFFEAEIYPSIHFISESVKKTAKGYVVEGTLTIKDVKKKVSIPFEYKTNLGKSVFEGGFQINRLDYNLGGKGKLIGYEVDILIRAVAEKVNP